MLLEFVKGINSAGEVTAEFILKFGVAGHLALRAAGDKYRAAILYRLVKQSGCEEVLHEGIREAHSYKTIKKHLKAEL